MNRVLEFRAWDGEDMIEWKNLQEISLQELSIGIWDGTPSENEQKKIDIMQFSGLYDIKGIKIYESDILSATTKSGTKLIGKAMFNHMGMFAFVYGDNYDKYFNIEALKTYHDIEVIGNIHQNPELL